MKCQKTYWPFHKAFCRKNDFADATEGTEPKFARWMRSHGKQAVLKDGEKHFELFVLEIYRRSSSFAIIIILNIFLLSFPTTRMKQTRWTV